MYNEDFSVNFQNIKANGNKNKNGVTKIVEPQRKAAQGDVEAYANLQKAEQKAQEAKAKQTTEAQANAAKLKELKGQAKENMKGREGNSVLDATSATDQYLDALIGNKTVFEGTGERTSKETGLKLQRVVKKGEDYFFNDDTHGKLQKKNDSWVFEDGTAPEEATQFDYQQWAKDGKREGTKTAGRGFNQRLANAIQRTVYKKVIQDMFAPEEFEAIRGQLKNKKLADITDIEFDTTEQTIIDVIYTPVVLGGEQDTQNRQIFADTWAQAEAKAKSEFSRVSNKSAVNEARAEVKQFSSAVKAHDKAYEKQLNEEAGPKPRTAEIVKSGVWTGFKVSGQGANASYMGRIERDDAGNKVFKVYAANRRTNDTIPIKDAAAWIENHIPDNYRDPIFNMAITEENPLSYVTNLAANAVESYTGKLTGNYKNINKNIEAAKDNMVQDMYIGKRLTEFLNAEVGKNKGNTKAEAEAKDKAAVDALLNNKARFIDKLMQMRGFGMDVDATSENPEDWTIVKADSIENDLLTKMLRAKQFAKDAIGPRTKAWLLKHGYKEREDGMLVKTYAPGNPNTKANRAILNKKSIGYSAPVKDKKTGKPLGDTAESERLAVVNQEELDYKPGLGILNALRSGR